MSKPNANEYKVDDQELLLDFYKKFVWTPIVRHIPASITPNSITIFGQLACLLAVVATWVAVSGGAPIFYIISALLMFTYVTADNIDGAHARRTGQTSPLGEFLDHGLDGMASGAILIITAMVLRVDGVWMALLCIMAALGFAVLFWEQFRTGKLVIPKFATTEGVTVLMIIQFIMAVGGEQTWLYFSATEITVGTVVVVLTTIAYGAVIIPPLYRAKRGGHRIDELVPLGAIGLSLVLFPILGGSALAASIVVGLFTADIVCRMIVLRHSGRKGPIVSAAYVLIVLPLLPAAVVTDPAMVTFWAYISVAFSAMLYATNLYRGAQIMLGQDRDHDPAAAV